MKKLELKLGCSIIGKYEINAKDIEKNCFAINKSFVIKHVFCDEKIVDYRVVEIKYNYKIISFQMMEGTEIIKIEYNGILDGTTGRYPYVKEKTTDNFYLLRSETIFCPTFELPESEEYLDAIINPSRKDEFQVLVTMENDKVICTNLNEESRYSYRGYNPTFAVGEFKEYKGFFGSIYHRNISKNKIINIERVIKATNEYMKQFKSATIEGFKIIVIPEGYGSFVLPETMFVAEEALDDYNQLVHELIHTNWNPLCHVEVQKSRFFDEAITQYFTARVCDAMTIKSYEKVMTEYKELYIKMIEKWEYVPHPIEEYHLYDSGTLSYAFGALALDAIENNIGRHNMNEIFIKMLDKYSREKIDFHKFRDMLPEGVKQVYSDYFLTNIASDKLIGEYYNKNEGGECV